MSMRGDAANLSGARLTTTVDTIKARRPARTEMRTTLCANVDETPNLE
jgi:hypothetical protein